MSRLYEFFEDDATRRGSMNRLAAFLAIAGLTIGFFVLLNLVSDKTGTDLREYLGAITTLAIIISGLGGFNYAFGRAAGAYTEARVAQAKAGVIPVLPVAPLGPTTVMNISGNPPEAPKAGRE